MASTRARSEPLDPAWDVSPLRLFLLAVAGWVQREQAAVIESLKVENRVLCEQLGGHRPRLTDAQRRRLAAKGVVLGRSLLAQIATLVTPDTILRWHRRLIAATDFLSAEVWTTRGLVTHYVLFVIDHATRTNTTRPRVTANSHVEPPRRIRHRGSARTRPSRDQSPTNSSSPWVSSSPPSSGPPTRRCTDCRNRCAPINAGSIGRLTVSRASPCASVE